jgi:hypothetical protein
MKLQLPNYKKICLVMILTSICSIMTGLFVSPKKAAIQAPQFRFSVNAGEYLKDDYITYKIEGALPNSPITFNQWRNDQFQGTFSAGNTDANGNWTALDWLGNYQKETLIGHFKRVYKVGSVTDFDECDIVDDNIWYCHTSSVNECLRITQEKRRGQPGQVAIPEQLCEDIPITYDLNEVKGYYLVVKHDLDFSNPPPRATIYDAENEQILTYIKIKARILHEPSIPCKLCDYPSTYPSSLDPVAPDDVILVGSGGVVQVGNITLKQRYKGNGALTGSPVVLLLQRNKSNPKIVYVACGPSCIYPISVINNVQHINVNRFGDNYIMEEKGGLHPLMSLNPVPDDPTTSGQFRISVTKLQNILNQK